MATATKEYTHASMDVDAAREFFADRCAFTTGPIELNRAIKSGEVNVVDLRAADDFAKGHVPSAVNIPQADWDTAHDRLDKDRLNVLYCYNPVCHLAAKAGLKFATLGFPVMELEGGWSTWQQLVGDEEK